MREAGYGLLTVGLLIALGSFFFPTSVDVVSASTFGVQRVVNLARLQGQMLTFASGAVLFLTGAIFAAAGAILEAMASHRVISPDHIAQPLVSTAQSVPDSPATPIPPESAEPVDNVTKGVVIVCGIFVIIFIVVFIALA